MTCNCKCAKKSLDVANALRAEVKSLRGASFAASRSGEDVSELIYSYLADTLDNLAHRIEEGTENSD